MTEAFASYQRPREYASYLEKALAPLTKGGEGAAKPCYSGALTSCVDGDRILFLCVERSQDRLVITAAAILNANTVNSGDSAASEETSAAASTVVVTTSSAAEAGNGIIPDIKLVVRASDGSDCSGTAHRTAIVRGLHPLQIWTCWRCGSFCSLCLMSSSSLPCAGAGRGRGMQPRMQREVLAPTRPA